MAIDLHALRTACAIAALAMGGAAASDSQTDPASNTRSANVIVRWQGDNPPTMINEPNGAPFTQEPADFTGTVPLPPAGVRFDDLDINFGDESYPLRLRIHPGL